MIPTKSNGFIKFLIDSAIDTWSKIVERCFKKLKNPRRMAIQLNKTADTYLGFIHIVLIPLCMRQFANGS